MPFDVKALLHNKPALIGVGVAGAAGLYVLLRRKSTTGTTASDASTTTGGATTGTGFPDTTGTDVAGWLGTQSGQLAAQQEQFLQQLQQLQQSSGGGTAAIPPTQPTGTMPPAYPRIPTNQGKTAIRPIRPIGSQPVIRPASGF
jgi:hypothetical protein